MKDQDDPKKEGHTREWQDRARVVLDAKKAAHTEASPKQSPVSDDDTSEDVEEKSEDLRGNDKEDPAY